MSQNPHNPYQPPGKNQGMGYPPQSYSPFIKSNPQVKTWQLVYVVLMAILYLLFAFVGIFLWVSADSLAAIPNADPNGPDAMEMQLIGIIYTFAGFGASVVFVVGLFWRRGMGGWIYTLILIVLGLTSCCTWPATIPLIIFWIKDKDSIIHG